MHYDKQNVIDSHIILGLKEFRLLYSVPRRVESNRLFLVEINGGY